MNNRLEQFVRDHREEFDAEEPDSKVWDAIGQDMGFGDSTKKKQASVVRLYRARWAAAAAIVLLIAGATWYLSSHRNSSNNLPAVASGNTGSPATQSATQPATKSATGQDSSARNLASAQYPYANHSQAATSPNTATNPKSLNGTGSGGATPDVANNAKPDANAELDASVNEEMYHYAKIVEIKHKELKAIQKDEPLLYKQFSADVYTLDSVYHSLQSQLPKNPNREQILEAMLQNLQLQMGLLNHQLDIIKQINHSKKQHMTKHIRVLSSISFLLVLSAPLVSMATGEGNMAPGNLAPNKMASGAGITAPGSGKMALHEGNEVKKTRLINKSYPVTADDKLDIQNQFGNVTVMTWDKAEITVDIEIGARAATDEKAQDIIDRIGVDDSKDDHQISFKTKVEEIHNSNGNRGREIEGERSFYIDYVIHMPSANQLMIENSFGKTEIPDFAGLVTLNSKFGSLNTGRLGNVDLVNVEFGRATIGAVTNGRVTFKYDKETRIGKVNGNVKITSDFSSNVQFNVADNVGDLSVFESYSAVRMVVGKDLSADIEAHTSFGSFHNDTEFTIKEHREDEGDYGPHFDKDYSGTAGDGKGKIRIKSSFGSVRISNTNGRDSDDDGDDDKDKEKDKHKSRTTTVSVSES